MSDGTSFFPLFLNLSNKLLVFVGAGAIATRRVKTIAPFADEIRVVACEASAEIEELAAAGELGLAKKSFEFDDIADADIVFACTDDTDLNERIWVWCKEHGVLVNVCSDHTKCDFYFPGVVQRGDFVVGVNASGKDHARAKALRQDIEKLLEDGYDAR